MNTGAKRFLVETFARMRPDNSLTINTVSRQLSGNQGVNHTGATVSEKP
jgi:hypothetical protein